MSSPLQSLNRSDPGRLATGQTKGLHEAKPSAVRRLSAQKNSPVVCFDSPLETVPTKNPIVYNKRETDPVRPGLTGLLVKNKNLSAKLRDLQSKLLIKETSLQEMKIELESCKENNVQQSLQILSLRDDIKDLQELIGSLMRIKSLKNTNIQCLEKGNWDLTERVIKLENCVRVHLVEREKAERKADILEKKLCTSRFPPYMNMQGQEESLDIFPVKDKGEVFVTTNFESDNIFYSEGQNDGQKFWDKCQQDLIHKEKEASELDRPLYSCSWEAKTTQSQHQDFLDQLATLLSDSIGPIPATEDAVKERIQEIGVNEQSWKSRTEGLQQEIQMLTKRVEQLHHLYEETAEELPQSEENDREQKRLLEYLEGSITTKDFLQGSAHLHRKEENSRTQSSRIDKHNMMSKQLEMLLDIQQNLQTATMPRVEEKIQKLQKQLSDLKLSNKNMKTQLTRINVLKDKTIEKLRQSLTKVETMKEKAVMKTENLKTTLDSSEHKARSDKEKAPHIPDDVPPKLSTTKSTTAEVSGREQELVDFRETILKMLGFNMKTADKEIINQLRLIIQVYEISNKSKISSECKTGQDKQNSAFSLLPRKT